MGRKSYDLISGDCMFKKHENKKFLKGFFLLIILLLSMSMISSCTAGENETIVKVPVKVNEYGFSREPLPFNQELYGYLDANDTLGNMHTYYLTDEQMAGLYYASNKTFDYPEGLILSYHLEEIGDSIFYGNYIVDHIYLPDGSEIQPVTGAQRDEFVNNSVNIGKECSFCEEYFGWTTSEMVND